MIDYTKRALGKARFERWVTKPTLLNTLAFVWGEHGLGVDAWKPKGDYLASAYVKSRKILTLLNNGSVQPVSCASVVGDGNLVSFLDEHGHSREMEFDLVVVCS